jgi:hypothetical protein
VDGDQCIGTAHQLKSKHYYQRPNYYYCSSTVVGSHRGCFSSPQAPVRRRSSDTRQSELRSFFASSAAAIPKETKAASTVEQELISVVVTLGSGSIQTIDWDRPWVVGCETSCSTSFRCVMRMLDLIRGPNRSDYRTNNSAWSTHLQQHI